MTDIYQTALPIKPDTLIVISRELRSYLGLSRDGGYLHHVRPVRLEEPIVADGKRVAGDLTCDCRGGQVRGTCYWVSRCESLEASDPAPFRQPSWHAPDPRAALEAGSAVFDAPAGAGDAQEAYRG